MAVGVRPVVTLCVGDCDDVDTCVELGVSVMLLLCVWLAVLPWLTLGV